ncbi:hypothetical protein LTR84_008850 [Exophiala bonariae]|uniref:Xylanolytic transcriptional activator regulatory domain-containing protein n=1 Tax=Exophiala bonariae TaxID=1690606 RepID=A0AAV9MZE9_9EURO|nr:hypothetical protein LTR84_008850 [Exophiala bonariae]
MHASSASLHTLEDELLSEARRRAFYMGRILNYYLPDLDLSTKGLYEKVKSLDSEQKAVDQSAAASPESESDVNDTLQGEECTINAVNDDVAHYSGELSYWNFSMRLNKHVKDLMDTEDQQDIPHYWRVEQLNSSPIAVSKAASTLPPLQIAEFLISVYLKHAAVSYFCFEPHWIVEKMGLIYNKTPHLTPKDAGALVTLLGVLAIGSQHAHLESPKNARTQRETDSHDNELGAVFYQQAARLLPEVIHLGSLESVQGCLLLGLYALPVDASGLGYIYLNLAMKMAMQNGMHRQAPDTVFAPEAISRRSKIWWTVYCLERKISIYHGRPISVRPMDIDVGLPHDEFEPLGQDSISSTSSLRTLIKLVDNLGQAADDILLLRNRNKLQTSGVLTRLISKRDEIKRWWTDLALHKQPFSRPKIHLQLEYCLLRMFLGRPFLVNREVPGLSPDSTSEDALAQQNPTRSTASQSQRQSSRASRATSLVDDCVSAATEAIDLCQALRDNDCGLAAVSYVEYSSCRASLLVLIAFCIRTQTIQCFDHQKRGLEMIREMAATGESARHEILLIEALGRALKRLHLWNQNTSPDSRASPKRPQASYHDFKQWRTLWRADKSVPRSAEPEEQILSSASRSQRTEDTVRQVHRSDLGFVNTEANGSDQQHDTATFGNIVSGVSASNAAPRTFDPSLFGSNSMFPVPNDFYNHSEWQLLERFLAIPDNQFPHAAGMLADSHSLTTSNLRDTNSQDFGGMTF